MQILLGFGKMKLIPFSKALNIRLFNSKELNGKGFELKLCIGRLNDFLTPHRNASEK